MAPVVLGVDSTELVMILKAAMGYFEMTMTGVGLLGLRLSADDRGLRHRREAPKASPSLSTPTFVVEVQFRVVETDDYSVGGPKACVGVVGVEDVRGRKLSSKDATLEARRDGGKEGTEYGAERRSGGLRACEGACT
jgi:hypothetical protein